MTQPLALLLYEKLLPGSQLANRLQDLGWRVQTLHDGESLTRSAEEHKPVLVLTDLVSSRGSVCAAIKLLRDNKSTEHIPVIAFAADEALHKEAAASGATLAVGDAAILQHLSQIIDQALTEF
jgi:CheY-like chemotaxis protein